MPPIMANPMAQEVAIFLNSELKRSYMSCLAFHRLPRTFGSIRRNPLGCQPFLQSICSSLILYYKRGLSPALLIIEIIIKAYIKSQTKIYQSQLLENYKIKTIMLRGSLEKEVWLY